MARPLAPEDVRKGDFVGVLHVTYELPSFLWCAESFQIQHDEPVRLQLTPEPGPIVWRENLGLRGLKALPVTFTENTAPTIAPQIERLESGCPFHRSA